MPIALVDRILDLAAKPDDYVLDNFLGSGTTGLACKKRNLNFIGIELNKNYFELANNRINENNNTVQTKSAAKLSAPDFKKT